MKEYLVFTNFFNLESKPPSANDSGKVVMKDGWPELIDFDKLRIAKAGRNQFGSKLHNSAD